MAKFSVGRDDDGEGSSDPWQKMMRIGLRYSSVDQQREPVNVEDESDAEEEEEEAEESDEENDDECGVVSDDVDEGEGNFDEEEQDQGRIAGHAYNGSNQVDIIGRDLVEMRL
ncbi:hypothetical protein O6P43_005666 [Quillaja saponaria]|uniref:Uncharacterized protein n=1 Tax=Quillaja saponaria TaxID=32244 RepID=A0AAD7Q6P2_QUISA|nr:hypothetical protein O6P43_005666 [Quillaja saponaria]